MNHSIEEYFKRQKNKTKQNKENRNREPLKINGVIRRKKTNNKYNQELFI